MDWTGLSPPLLLSLRLPVSRVHETIQPGVAQILQFWLRRPASSVEKPIPFVDSFRFLGDRAPFFLLPYASSSTARHLLPAISSRARSPETFRAKLHPTMSVFEHSSGEIRTKLEGVAMGKGRWQPIGERLPRRYLHGFALCRGRRGAPDRTVQERAPTPSDQGTAWRRRFSDARCFGHASGDPSRIVVNDVRTHATHHWKCGGTI